MRRLLPVLFLIAACSPAATTTTTTAVPSTSTPSTASPTPTTSPPVSTTQVVTTASSVTEIEIAVAGGVVTPPAGRVPVPLGNTVRLVVTSDVADEIHVHGYDISTDVEEGGTAEVEFVADVPGIFEVELEDAVLPLVELEVS
jgi:hypothetical protein